MEFHTDRRPGRGGQTGVMSIEAVVLDLDGVVRHFGPGNVAEVEARHGLAEGALMAAAFEPSLLEQVITGQISRAEWGRRVGVVLGSPAAAADWQADQGRIDWDMMALVDQLRAAGFVVAVLTNGTDTIAEEMQTLGVDDRFDAIFNSALIGYAKPDRRAFEYVSQALGVSPSAIFFTDDSPSKLAGAIEIGMHARTFEGIDTFRLHLAELLDF